MRFISQSELLRTTKFELQVLLREITASLPRLAEGSHELRIAHYNPHNIRLAIAKPELRPRRNEGCHSACNIGSDAILVQLLFRAD